MTAPLEELARSLVDLSQPTQRFGIYVLPNTDPAAELGRAVEREVFAEFFGNSPELLAAEYAPYEPATVFLCVVDHHNLRPAGSSRMLLPSACGLKSLDDIDNVWGENSDAVIARSEPNFDRSRCVDVATLAVGADYRGAETSGLISITLYMAMVMTAYAVGAPWLAAVMDIPVLDAISERMADPFTRFSGLEPKSYLDSPASVPVFVDFMGWRPRLHERDSASHDILYRGTGLETAVWTPDWDLVTQHALETLGLHSAAALPRVAV